MDRDPRVDPKVGDVVRREGAMIEIQAATESGFIFKYDGPVKLFPVIYHWQDWLPIWREWAKNAKVIHAAD